VELSWTNVRYHTTDPNLLVWPLNQYARYANYNREGVRILRRYKTDGEWWSEWEDYSSFLTLYVRDKSGGAVDSNVRRGYQYEYIIYRPYKESFIHYSTTQTIPITPPEPPAACSVMIDGPTSLRVSASTSSATCAGQADIYRVYARFDPTGIFTYLGPMELIGIRVGSHVFHNFVAGKPYFFEIKAVNTAGESEACTTSITIPTDPPAAPTDVEIEADASGEQATLTWTYGDDVATSDAPFMFSVWHALEEEGPYEEIVNTISSERSFTAQLRDGAVNYFHVKADNYLYESEPSNTVSVTVPPVPPDLGADPVTRTTTLSPTEVRLTWRTNRADDRRIRIQRSLSDDPSSFVDIHTTTSSSEYAFVDSALQPDTEYFYRVVAFNAAGVSEPSAVVAVRTYPLPVYPPSFLKATPRPDQRIDLEWWDINTSEDAYFIEYTTHGDDAFVEFATVGKDTETFTTPPFFDGFTYTFRVRAVNRVGFSGYSDPVSVFLPSSAPPAPSSLEGTFIGNALLKWQISETAHVTSFIIERSETETEGFAEVASVPFDPQCKYSTQGVPGQDCARWYSPATMLPGDDFYYRVRARNSAGDSQPSNTVRVTGPLPVPPASPTDLSATFVRGASGGFLLQWNDRSDNEDGFEIERRIEAVSPDWIPQYPVPADWEEYMDNSFSYSTMQFRIRAHNRGGYSDWSNVASAVRPPQFPWSLTGTALPGGIALQWEDQSSNETNFVIVRSVNPRDDQDYAFLHQTGPEATAFTDVTVRKGVTYHYRVLARNAGGDSAPSNTIVVTALPDPPAGPSDLTLTSVPNAPDIVQLTWTDNDADEEGFKIERSLAGTEGSWTQIGTKQANVTMFNDTQLLPGTRYHYRVRSFNAGGDSAYCLPESIVTPLSPPAAPDALIAEVLSSARILLHWTDRSTNETGFAVERAPSAAGPWSSLSTTLENVTTFIDTNLQPETQYVYRVRSLRSGVSSPFSNTVSATTHTFIAAPINLFATALSARQIDLSWVDQSNNETGFVIERRNEQDVGISWTIRTTTGANATAFTDRDLSPANHYLYRIRAIRGSMYSEYSNDAPATTFSCILDGVKEAMEFCDDGDTDDGDGCSSFCTVEPQWGCSRVNGERSICQRCGNGVIEGNEECDDDNTDNGDGCGAYGCLIEGGWTCTGEPSRCHKCGNETIEPGETCDDGDTDATDGCDQCHITENWTCTGEPSVCQLCGNGIREGSERTTGECDDGDTTGGDGCSALCRVETGWTCYGHSLSVCKRCGNGIIEGNENCDDGDVSPKDGCSDSCRIESQWACTGSPSKCYPCGDGILDPGQECDQKGSSTLNGDGCSASCTLEPGWSCTEGQNSLCTNTCGDGIKNGVDSCDDGNQTSQDGCSASCRVETGWSCSGTPSRCLSPLALRVLQLLDIDATALPTLRQRIAFTAAALRAEQEQNLQFDANGDGFVRRLDTRLLLGALRQLSGR